MKFGLSEKSLATIISKIEELPMIEKAVVYGSRAKGNYREGSDVDITLFGDDLQFEVASKLWGKLDDSNLPYLFDVSIFEKINNEDLKEHIMRVGQVLYEKGRC